MDATNGVIDYTIKGPTCSNKTTSSIYNKANILPTRARNSPPIVYQHSPSSMYHSSPPGYQNGSPPYHRSPTPSRHNSTSSSNSHSISPPPPSVHSHVRHHSTTTPSTTNATITTTNSYDPSLASPGSAQQLQEELELLMGCLQDQSSNITAEGRAKIVCNLYNAESAQERTTFLKALATKYGVDESRVASLAQAVISAQDRPLETQQQTQDRLRLSLVPRYHHLFTQISRLDHGVKFLVDLRTDILKSLSTNSREKDLQHLHLMNSTLRDLLASWFSVGLLNLERITWQSPCDMVQKISAYEVVHPIRSWVDVKRRVGAYRRCFVFTHSSMPREPLVVLNTALTSHISDSIQSIVRPLQASHQDSSPSRSPDVSSTMNRTSPLGDEVEDPTTVNTAIFYSIISTQKGLQGVELGNYLIKKVVRELQYEYPNITQFSSLSPIPGFKDWLMDGVNKVLNSKGDNVLLTDNEMSDLTSTLECSHSSVYKNLKKTLSDNTWAHNDDLVCSLRAPLQRLCVQYLYLEKRRGYALNPVANFHLRNGAVMWRLNWLGDTSPRGLGASLGMMVNYRYYLNKTEENSIAYQEGKHITVDEQVTKLLKI